MKRSVLSRVKTPSGYTLIYILLSESHFYGVEILQIDPKGIITRSGFPALFRQKEPALRLLLDLEQYVVYPVHLEDILSDLDLL